MIPDNIKEELINLAKGIRESIEQDCDLMYYALLVADKLEEICNAKDEQNNDS